MHLEAKINFPFEWETFLSWSPSSYSLESGHEKYILSSLPTPFCQSLQKSCRSIPLTELLFSSWNRYLGWSIPKGMQRCWYLPRCLHSLLQWSHPRVHGLSPHPFSPHRWQLLVIKNFLTSLLWLGAMWSVNTKILQIQKVVFISTIPSVENLRSENYAQVTETCNKIVIATSFHTDP